MDGASLKGVSMPSLLPLFSRKLGRYVNGVYKIISKVLANTLKAVLEKVMSRSYNAF
jgi:hypothetical protein